MQSQGRSDGRRGRNRRGALMPVTKRLYPYSISGQLDLRPEDPFDPTQEEDVDLSWLVRSDASDDELLTLDLSAGNLNWNALSVRLHARLPSAEAERVLPPGSQMVDDTSLVVSINSTATKLRRIIVLPYQDEGHWSGDVTIHREEVRGTVKLIPRLVRRTDFPGDLGSR